MAYSWLGHWRIGVAAYMLGFMAHVAISMLAAPILVLLALWKENWSHHFEAGFQFIAAFFAGFICAFVAPPLGWLPALFVPALLAFTFIINDLRRLAEGVITPSLAWSDAAGFFVGISSVCLFVNEENWRVFSRL